MACFEKHQSSGNDDYSIKIEEILSVKIETCAEKQSHQCKPVVESRIERKSEIVIRLSLTLAVQVQSPIELGDDEESDRIPSHILERIGWNFL